jgi:DNA gyrase subunit A
MRQSPNRRKLTGAYSDKSPLKSILVLDGEREVADYSTEGRALVFNTGLLAPKATRNTQESSLMTMKPNIDLIRRFSSRILHKE